MTITATAQIANGLNIRQKYRDWTIDLVREDIQKTVFPYSCFMFNWSGDMNMASAIRSGNGLGCKEFFYFGKKAWDRRGSVGTHHYSMVTFIREIEQFVAMKEKYHFIAIDNNHEFKCTPMKDFQWETKDGKEPLLVFGEEGNGLTPDILSICDDIVFIPMFGSVPSFNVSCCASMVMYDIVNKKFTKEK